MTIEPLDTATAPITHNTTVAAAPTARTLPAWALVTTAFVATRLVVLAGLSLGGRRAAGGGSIASALVSGAWHWDAHWYIGIALDGYEFVPGTASNVVFFPATPLLIRAVTALGVHPVGAGMLLSSAFAALGCAAMVAALRSTLGERAAVRGTVLLVVWPSSVFFALPYTDGLLFAACAGVFYFALKRQLLLAALVAAVAAAARSTGLFLAVPLALMVYEQRQRWDRRALIALLAGGGTAGYCLYQWIEFGNPLAFASAESAGWSRVALPPPLTVGYTMFRLLTSWALLAAGRPDRVLSDVLDLASLGLVASALWLAWKNIPWSMWSWPALAAGWPLLAGTWSANRFALLAFPAFAVVSEKLSDRSYKSLVMASVGSLALASYSFGAGGWVG